MTEDSDNCSHSIFYKSCPSCLRVRIAELGAQLAHTQELLRCVERDISGEPYIEHCENNAWFRAKEKATREESE